jgi:phospholipase/carboxylesterase
MVHQQLPHADPVYLAGPDDWFNPNSYLIHCVRLPREASLTHPAPLVVMIHGWAGDENSMWAFKQVLPKDVAVVTPRAPLELDQGGYIWYRRGSRELQVEPATFWTGLKQLSRFLSDLPQQYPIDPARLILVGFSQGAVVCHALALTQPGLAMGVASLAGHIPNLLADTAQVGSLQGLSVFIAHGTRDDVVPVEAGRQSRNLYTRLGAQVTYGEYHIGHKLSMTGKADLKHWLAQVLINAF